MDAVETRKQSRSNLLASQARFLFSCLHFASPVIQRQWTSDSKNVKPQLATQTFSLENSSNSAISQALAANLDYTIDNLCRHADRYKFENSEATFVHPLLISLISVTVFPNRVPILQPESGIELRHPKISKWLLPTVSCRNGTFHGSRRHLHRLDNLALQRLVHHRLRFLNCLDGLVCSTMRCRKSLCCYALVSRRLVFGCLTRLHRAGRNIR